MPGRGMHQWWVGPMTPLIAVATWISVALCAKRNCSPSRRGSRLIEVPLKVHEQLADLSGVTQLIGRISNRVVVLEPDQRREFGQIEFLDALLHVVVQDEVDEG